MRILGLDPGIARTGYAVLAQSSGKVAVLAYGCIETHKGKPYQERLLELSDKLEDILDRFRPTCAGIEKLFFRKNVRTAIAVGQARGVLLVTLARHQLTPQEFTPQQIKSAVTGYGKADKRQVQRMVQLLLKLKTLPQPDDAADALAIAITASFIKRPVDRL